MSNKPFILYHGRRDLVDVIPCEQGFDSRGNPEKNQFGVYATPMKDYAAFFALYRSGLKTGYIYKLNPDGFTDIGGNEFLSTRSVKPIDFEIAYPLQYIEHLINGSWCYGKRKRFLINQKLRSTRKDVENCLGDIDMKSLNEDNYKTVAKRLLYMDIRRAMTKCEENVATIEELYELLRKLEVNWEEYIV